MRKFASLLSPDQAGQLENFINSLNVCADKVSVENADVVFVSQNNINNIPENVKTIVVLVAKPGLTRDQVKKITAWIKTGKEKVAYTWLWRRINQKIPLHFLPKTSCAEKQQKLRIN